MKFSSRFNFHVPLLLFARYTFTAMAVVSVGIFIGVLFLFENTLKQTFTDADAASTLQVHRAVRGLDTKRFDEIINFLDAKRRGPGLDWDALRNPFAVTTP